MVGLERFLIAFLALSAICKTPWADEKLLDASQLKMFVDELPDMPKIKGYDVVNGDHVPKSLIIGMFHKKWVS